MKAALISLLTVGLAGSLIGGGVFASFSDSETSAGNTFQAGTIDISLAGETAFHHAGGQSGDFKPCQTGYLAKRVTNVGTNPAQVFKKIGGVIGSEPTPDNDPEAEAEALIADPAEHVPGADDFLFGLVVRRFSSGGELISESVVVPSDGDELGNVVGKWIELGVIAPGEYLEVIQGLHLKADAGNELQGDVASVDEEFLGQQTIGSPSPPGPLYVYP